LNYGGGLPDKIFLFPSNCKLAEQSGFNPILFHKKVNIQNICIVFAGRPESGRLLDLRIPPVRAHVLFICWVSNCVVKFITRTFNPQRDKSESRNTKMISLKQRRERSGTKNTIHVDNVYAKPASSTL